MKKIADILSVVTGFGGAIWIFLFILSPLVYLPPMDIDDFVVDSGGNIVAVSSFQRRIFLISKQGHVFDSIKIPESKGNTLMAIDSSDNIYINRLRNVEIYAINRKPRLYSAALDKTNDWLLTKNGTVTNMNRSMNYYSYNTMRHRRITNPGEFIFFDSISGESAGVYDDFSAHRRVYSATASLRT